MTTFLDTNVLIYLTGVGELHERALAAYNARRAVGPILVCDIVYAEYSIALNSRAEVDTVIRDLALVRVSMTDEALFEATRIFRAYRERAGQKEKPLPDHFIGAQAKISGAPVLTHNGGDFAHIEGLDVIGI